MTGSRRPVRAPDGRSRPSAASDPPTAAERALAAVLSDRAHKIRAASDGGISIREAIDLASVQLGYGPTNRNDNHA